MAVIFSTFALKALGYRNLEDGERLAAVFYSITVYEVQGLSFAENANVQTSGTVAGIPYKIVAGNSVNSACIELVNEDFTDDESVWRKENRTRGPFVLVSLGPTAIHECTSGSVRTEADGTLSTINRFQEAHEELDSDESKSLPILIAALTCGLSDSNHPVRLRKIQRAAIGRMTDGRLLHSTTIELRAEVTVAQTLSRDSLHQRMLSADRFASSLDLKASRLFSLGLAESDPLKRFLFFFLTIEIQTHATFQATYRAPGTPGPGAAATAGQSREPKNLSDRFAWCASNGWKTLGEREVEQFRALKKARDLISHGEMHDPTSDLAQQSELLARRVLGESIS